MATSSTPVRPAEHLGVCGVCGRRAEVRYDARFDAEVCDVCDGLLTIRDDEFRRAHPEHDASIQAIWRDRRDPANARAIGLAYYELGYWREQEEQDAELDEALRATDAAGPGD